jgi:arylsulfatase A-like enzyme
MDSTAKPLAHRPRRAARRAHFSALRAGFLAATALAASLLVTQLPGCTGSAKPDILLIVVDTLRADRVGAISPGRKLTPFLDSLAAHGYVFHNVYAQSSWTNASVASLFTSRYQSEHRVMSFWATLGESETTLAELLDAHGYASAAFVANFLLRGDLGYGQGFQHYQLLARSMVNARGEEKPLKGSAEQVNQAALAWLDEVAHSDARRQPGFLYVHYMEPHAPYDPPDRFLDAVLAGRPRPDIETANRRASIPNFGTFSDALVADIVDLYDAEILSVDDQIRVLFGELQKRGFLRNAIVAITSDHGEEFREHGTMGHHQALYEESIRVPLILLVPGHDQRVDIQHIVSLTDLAPTLLDLAAIPRPASFRGVSLASLMGLRTEATPSAMAFSELIKETTDRRKPHERAIVTDDDKLILGAGGELEFFDLQADPGETNPQGLAADRRANLRDELRTFIAGAGEGAAPAARRTVDPDTLERMRALGYAP